MRRTVVTCLILASSFASAKMHDLLDDLHQRNLALMQAQIDQKKAQQELKAFEAQNDWRLDAGLSRRDSFPAAFISFQSQRTVQDTFEYNLAKSFSWGGELAFSQEVSRFDLSNWQTSQFFQLPSENPFQVTNTLSYQQDIGPDFFGIRYDLDWKQKQESTKVAKLVKSWEEENQLFSLFSSYTSAKYNKALVSLNEQALKRAKTRLKEVQKRIKDGLSLKVDSYQAQKALLAQQEKLNQAKANLIDSLENINQSINKKVSEKLIIPYSLTHAVQRSHIEKEDINNLELKVAIKNLQLAKLSLESAERGLYPQARLNYSLANSSIDASFSDSLDGSRFGKTFKTETFGINVSIPLGFNMARAEIAMKKAEMAMREHGQQMIKKRIVNSIGFLERKQQVLIDNLESAKKRVRLSRLALNEQNRLYNLGRVDLDTVIRSEEDLIDTQIVLVSYLMNVEVTAGSVAKLNGQFVDFFVNYSE